MSDAHHYTRVPGKRMAVAALFYDSIGRVLIVKPAYRPEWLLPGGSVEAEESPRAACVREVAEELGLTVQIGRLLSIEYLPTRPNRPESVKMIFDGGLIDGSIMAQIQPLAGEIADVSLYRPEAAIALLAPRIRARAQHALLALRNGSTVYLEDGRPVG